MAPAEYSRLLRHLMQDGLFRPFLASPDRARHRAEWRAFIAAHRSRPPASREEAESFHDHWHVCHHILRELVDDEPAVLDMLWVWLPPYEGADLVLYRGENLDRVEAGHVGIAWTDKIENARMFAGGLNAVGRGGALIRATAPPRAIISGPSKHSRYLQENEFTVDFRELGAIEILERFPPSI